jgi:predicted RecA/RadA family phage recombinase
MALNFIKPGKICTFTAPGGGVVSGTPVLIGTLVVVPLTTVAAGLPFEGDVEGIWLLPKIAGVAWTEGALLYFDTAANNFGTVVSATTRRAGVAAAAALSGDLFGQVRLNGVGAPANVA